MSGMARQADGAVGKVGQRGWMAPSIGILGDGTDLLQILSDEARPHTNKSTSLILEMKNHRTIEQQGTSYIDANFSCADARTDTEVGTGGE